jgi:hypothetical protein
MRFSAGCNGPEVGIQVRLYELKLKTVNRMLVNGEEYRRCDPNKKIPKPKNVMRHSVFGCDGPVEVLVAAKKGSRVVAILKGTTLNNGEPMAYEKATLRDSTDVEWAQVSFGYDVLELGRVTASRFGEGFVVRNRLCEKKRQ